METNTENENKMKIIINNKCIENHIQDMLENLLEDENKSKIDLSILSESKAEESYNEYLKFSSKNLKDNFIKSNILKEYYQKLKIFINPPDSQNEFMDRMYNNNSILNYDNNHGIRHNNLNNLNNMNNLKNMNNFNNMNNFIHNNNNNNNNINHLSNLHMIPGINNLSPINNKNVMKNLNFNNKNINNFDDDFKFNNINNMNKIQTNRLHVNYVSQKNHNQNMYNRKNTNNFISPRDMGIVNNTYKYSSSNSSNLNPNNIMMQGQGGFYSSKSLFQRETENINNKNHNSNFLNPSPNSYNRSSNDRNSYSSNIR
jgi:hypothetical protein